MAIESILPDIRDELRAIRAMLESQNQKVSLVMKNEPIEAYLPKMERVEIPVTWRRG